jgi:fibronectin-binding autotransporter adhesin
VITRSRLLVFLVTLLFVGSATANPEGGVVASGNVQITQSAGQTTVQQNSQQAIINWQSFNIGAGEKTHFQQPQGGMALNRINATQGPSQIYGQLTATGKIILVNQSGIFFGPGSYVNVGGIIATTSNITDQNFLAGKLIFDQPSPFNASVINKGTIIAAQNGLVALLGTGVSNEGMIQARTGNVVLASGSKFTVDLYGDQLINFAVNEGTTNAGIDEHGNKLKNGVNNSGTIMADGGTIQMTAKTAASVVDNVINMDGIVQANTVSQKNGVIILGTGNEGSARVTGKVYASGKQAGQTGGKVKVLAKTVAIGGDAEIDVSGDAGGGEVLIGGNYQGKGPEQNAEVTYFDPTAMVNASAITNGDGGKVIFWADDTTRAYGTIVAQGGSKSGNGGFAETSGKIYLDVADIRVDLTAVNGATGNWLLDPTNINVVAGSGSTFGAFNSASPNVFVPNNTGTPATVGASLIAANLNTASVTINTFSAGSDAGNIVIQAPITWTSANTLTFTANGSITQNAGSTITNTTAAGALVMTAPNGITLNADINTIGTHTYNNAVTIGASTAPTITGTSFLFGSTISISSGATLTLSNSNATTISSAINGAGNFAKGGDGTLNLTAANGYAGTTAVNRGVLSFSGTNGAAISSAGFSVSKNATLTLDNSGANNNNRIGNTVDVTMLGGEFIVNGSSNANTAESIGTLTLNANYSTITLVPNSGFNTLVTFASLSRTTGASGLFRGTSLGANTVASATANTSNIVFTAAPALVGGGNSGTTSVGVISGIIGAATSASTGTDFMTYNPTGGTVNGLRPLTAAEYSATPSTGVNVKLTASTNRNDSFNVNSLLLAPASGSLNYNFDNTGAANTFIIDSGNILSINASNTISASANVSALAFGTVTANIFSPGFTVLLGSNTNLTGTGGIAINTGNIWLGRDVSISGGITANSGGIFEIANTFSTAQALTIRSGGTFSVGSASTTMNAITMESGSYLTMGAGSLTMNGDLTVNTNGSGVGNAIISSTSVGGLILGGNRIFNVADGLNDVNLTVSVPISGAFTLTKQGLGTLELSGNNSYTGTTTVSAGILNAANNTALGGIGSAGTTVASGATLNINDGIFIDGEALSLNGTGATGTLGALTGTGTSGISDSGGGITLGSATTIATNEGATFTIMGNNNFSGAFALTLAGTGAGTINSTIGTGTGTLNKVDSGTWTLGNGNTFTGLTTVSNGTLAYGANNIIGTGNITIDGASTILAVNDFSDSVGVLTLSNNASITGTGIITGTSAFELQSGTVNIQLGGNSLSVGVNKTTSGTVTLTNTLSSFIGDVSVNAGLLVASSINTTAGAGSALGSGSNINIGSTGTLQIPSGTFTTDRTIRLSGSGGTVDTGTSANLTFNAPVTTTPLANNFNLVLTGSGTGLLASGGSIGTGSITKNGTGTWTSTITTYGATIINAGTLQIGTGGSSGNLGSGNVTNNSALIINLSSAIAFGNVISGSGTLTKAGSSSLTLSGANTYTGKTTVSNGTLIFNSIGNVNGGASALGNPNSVGNGTIDLAGAATLQFNGSSNSSSNRVINLTSNNGTINASGSGALTLSGGVTGNAFSLILTGTGTGTSAGTLSGVIGTVSGGLTKNDTGTWILSGTNTYTGATNVNAGTLSLLNNNSALGTSSSVAVAALATLNLSGVSINRPMTLTGTITNTNTSSTYSGLITTAVGPAVTINNVDAGVALNITGGVAGSGALIINGAGNTTVNTIGLSMTAGLTKNGTGTLTLARDNSYTGATIINAGEVVIQSASGLGTTGGTTTVNAGALRINASGLTIAESLILIGSGNSGAGALINQGTGNTISSSISLGSGATISSNSGSLALVSGITGSNVSLTFNNSSNTDTGDITVSGSSISLGNGGVTKYGTGTLALSAVNSYTGATAINAGTVTVNTAFGGLGTSSGVTVASGATLNLSSATIDRALTINGTGVSGVGALTGTSSTYSGAITLGSASTITATSGAFNLNSGTSMSGSFGLTLAGAGSGSISSVIGTGSGTVTKNGNGTWTLRGANTYTGATTISAGTLQAGAINTIPVNSAVSLSVSGAVLDLNSFSQSISSLTGVTGTSITSSVAGTPTLTVNNSASTTFSGVIGNGSGTVSLAKTNTGTLTLAGVNTYSGGTTINGGAISISADSGLGAAPGAAATNITLDGGTLNISSSFTLNGNRRIALNTGGSTIDVNSGITLTYNGLIQDGTSNSFTKSGTGTLILTGGNLYTGQTVVNAGTLQLGNITSSGRFGLGSITNNGAIIFSRTTAFNVTNDISGSGTFEQQNAIGAITLSGNNTYSGLTTVTAGTLNVGSATGLGSSAAGTVVASGATLNINSGVSVGNEALSLTGIGNGGVGALTGTGTSSFGGLITLAGATTIGANSGATFNITNAGSITGSGLALTLSGAGNGTIGSIIGTGAGTVTKSDAGVWTLSNANTYSGNTTISAGTLALSGSGSIASSASIITTGTFDISGATTGASIMTMSGAGGVSLGSRNLTLTNGSGQTFSGVISDGGISGGTGGSFSLTGGNFTLSNQNVYTGATTISAGILSVATIGNGGVAGNLGAATNAASNLRLDGGTLQYTGATASTDRNFTLTAGKTSSIDVTTNNLTITGASTATTGALTKLGAGTLTLGGTNLYTGATTISAGILSVATIGNGGGAGNLGAATNAASNLVLDGGTLQYTGATASTDRNFTLTAAKTSSIDVTTNNLTISGASTATTGALTKLGAGTLTLGGTNLYTGATTISSGILSVATIGNGGVAGNLGAATNAASNLILDGGTLQYTGATASTDRNFTLTAAKTSSISVTTNNLTITGASAATTGALTKLGSGTLTLGGANSHTGAITISSGILSVATIFNGGVASNLGAASNVASNLILDGGTLQYTGATASTNRNFTLTAAKTSSIDVVTNTLTISGASTATTGALTKLGAGKLILFGTNLNTGTTTIGAGDVEIGDGNLSANVGALGSGNIVNNGNLIFNHYYNTTINNAISGTGSLIKEGFGMLTLTGSNSYGSTIINSGILEVGNNGSLGSGSVSLGLFTTLRVNQPGTVTIGGNISGVGGIDVLGGGRLILTGANSYASTMIGNGTLQIGNGGTTGTLGSGVVTVNGTLEFNRSDDNYIVNNFIIADGFYGDLVKSGAGTVTLAGGSTHHKGITTINAGTLQVGNGGVGGSLGDSGNINIASGAVLEFNHSNNIAIDNAISGSGSLKKSGSGTLTLTAANSYGDSLISGGTLQIGNGSTTGSLGSGDVINNSILTFNRSDDVTVSNAISGSGVLTKLASNTLTLTGSNSYGNTTISAGALQVGSGSAAGSLGTGAVTNNSSLIFNRSDDVVLANPISGSGGLTKLGAGKLTLTANNSYGTTTITAGTLQIGNAGSTGSLGSGNVTNNSSLIFNRSTDVTVSNLITGTGSLRQSGANTITLTSASFDINSVYSGGTTIDSGATLQIGNDGVNQYFGTGPVTLNGTLIFNSASDQVISSNISGLGSLIQSGAGKISLFAINSYGNTTVSSGSTLRAVGPNAMGSTGTITNNGLLELNATGDVSNLIVGSGALKIVGGTSVGLRASNTYTGTTTIESGAVLSIGDSSLPSGGINATLGSGDVINNGTLSFITGSITVPNNISGTGSLSTGVQTTTTLTGLNTYTGSTTIGSGTTLNIGSGGANGTIGVGEIINNGTLFFNSTSDMSLSSNISGSGVITLYGPNRITLTGTNNYSGKTTIYSSAILQIGAGGTVGSLGTGSVDNYGALVFNRSNSYVVNNAIAQSGSLTQAGAGTLTLTGNNTYYGDTIINLGSTLQIGNGGSTGASTADFTGIQNNGSLLFNLTGNVVTGYSIGGTGSVVQNGSGTVTIIGGDFSGPITINAGTLALKYVDGSLPNADIIVNNSGIFDASIGGLSGFDTSIGSLSGSGLVNLGGARLKILNPSDTVFSGFITDNGINAPGGTASGWTGSLILESGHLTLTGNNYYSGYTIVNGGTLTVGTIGALGVPTISYLKPVYLGSGATLQYTGVGESTNRPFALLGNATIDASGSGALTLTGNVTGTGRGLTLSGSGVGVLSSNIATGTGGTVTKSGAGAWTISGNNTYTGGTNISAGTLNISDSSTALGTGTVSIANGAVLGLTGSTALNIANNINLIDYSLIRDNSSSLLGNVISGNITATSVGGGTPYVEIQANNPLAINGTINEAIGNTMVLYLSGTNNLTMNNAIGDLNLFKAVILNGLTTLVMNGSNVNASTQYYYGNVFLSGSAPILLTSTDAIYTGVSLRSSANTSLTVRSINSIVSLGSIPDITSTEFSDVPDPAGANIDNSYAFISGIGDLNIRAYSQVSLFKSYLESISARSIVVNVDQPTSNVVSPIEFGNKIDSGNFSIITSGAQNYNAQVGTSSVTSISLTAGNAGINLTNSSNILSVPVSFYNTGNNDVNVVNAQNLILDASNVGGVLSATSSSAITQSGAITASSLVTNSVSGVALTNAANSIGNFTASNTGSGNIALTNANRSLTLGLITQAGTGTINIANNSADITISNIITSQGGAISFATSGAGVINLSSIIRSNNGAIDFNGPVMISANGVRANGGLTGVVNFNGIVSSGSSQNTLILQNGSGGGTVTFNDNASLWGLSTFARPYAVIFNGSVNSFGITTPMNFLNTGGVTFAGTTTFVGGVSTPVSSTTTLLGNLIAPGAASINLSTSGVINLNGNSNITAGNINLGAVTSIDSPNNLTLDISGAGSISAYNESGFFATGSSITKAGIGTLTFSNASDYSGATNVNAGTLTINHANALGNTSGTTIANNATLNISNVTLANTAAITVNSGGRIALDAATISNPLSVSGTGISNGGAIATSGSAASIINGAITLADNTSFVSTNSGDTLTINGAINGGYALNVTGAGKVDLTLSTIGASAKLASMTVNTTEAVDLHNVSTTGAQTYTGSSITTHSSYIADTGDITFNAPLILADDMSITATTGRIYLNNTVDGAYALAITAGDASYFTNNIGGITPLSSVAVNGPVSISANVTTSGLQTYNSAITLLNNVSLITTGSGNVSLSNGVNGAYDLSLVGGSNNTFTLGGSLAVNNINVLGGTGSNSLYINNALNQTWTITGANAGTVTGIADLAGTLTFSNIQGWQSGTGTNTLVAADTANTWVITGANTGTVTGLAAAFVNFQNLRGGSETDSFTLNSGSLSGSINGGAGANSLTGDNVSNTWTITGANSGTVTGVAGGFSNIQSLIGGSSTDSFNLNGNTFTGSIAGGAGANTIRANNVANTWNITGLNTGTVNGVTGGFSAIQSLVGGSDNDTFTFNSGASVANVDAGAGGINLLDYSNYGSAVSFVIGGAATGITTSNANFTRVVGSTIGLGTLIGANGVNAWGVTDNNAGTVTGLSGGFAQFNNLVGGTDNDTFTFTNGKRVTGTINGGAGGVNTLNLANYTTTVGVVLSGSGANGFSGTTTGSPNPTGGFSNITAVTMSGAGTSSITGQNTNSTWSLLGNNTGIYSNGSQTLSYGAVPSLIGGSANDIYIFSDGAGVSNWIYGNAGVNTFDYSAYTSVVDVRLNANKQTGTLGATGVNVVIGGTANENLNTLTPYSGTTNWNIASQNDGTFTTGSNTVTFNNFGNLVGTSSTDNFVFGTSGSLTGTVNGAAGNNTLNYSAYSTPIYIDLALATASHIAGGISNIKFFIGGSSTANAITGANTPNAWSITANNAGNVNSGAITFSNFGNLVGGSNADTFTFTNTTVRVATINGGTGLNTLDYTNYNNNVVNINLQTGSAPNVTTASLINNYIGGTGVNRITGANSSNTWNITNSNSGNINGTISFSKFGTLVGGTAGDTFNINAGSLTGTITGSGSALNNTLTYNNYSGAVNVNLVTNTATAIGGFSNIGNFIGTSAATNSTLAGKNSVSTWNITGTNAGNIVISSATAANFSQFGNLVGSNQDDTFIFNNGANIASGINGGNGNNTLNYSAYTTPVNVSLSGLTNISNISGSASLANSNTITGPTSGTYVWSLTGANSGSITGTNTYTFNNFGTWVAGSGSSNSLAAQNVTNTWAVTGFRAGNLNSNYVNFSGFNTLVGGSVNDTFVFADGASIGINGGLGSNVADYSAYTTPVSINLSSGSISNINTLIGSTDIVGNNTLIAQNTTNTWDITGNNTGTLVYGGNVEFSNFGNLVGGSVNDTFVFNNNANVASITGGTGVNTFDYSASSNTNAITINLANGSVNSISRFIGPTNIGEAINTIIGPNTNNTWRITGNNSGNIDNNAITFSQFGNLTGGNAANTYIFSNASVNVSGTIMHGTLDYSAYNNTAVIVNLASGSASGAAGISDISNIIGGRGDNTIIGGNAATTWNITSLNSGNINSLITFSNFKNLSGGTSADTFIFSNNTGVSGSIQGGAGSANTFNYSAYSAPITINLLTGVVPGVSAYSGISNFIGNEVTASSNTIISANTNNTWNITNNNVGNINGTISFSNFGNLNGGRGDDNFVFVDGKKVTGVINGGTDGVDTLNLSNYTTAVSITLTSANLGRFSGVTAGTPNPTGGFDQMTQIIGGTANNTLTTTDLSTVVTLTNANSGYLRQASNTLNFIGFVNLVGGTGANMLIASDNNNTWNISANNTGNIGGSFNFSNFANLVGGSENDTFVFSDGASANAINGNGGTNILNYSAYTTPITISLDLGLINNISTIIGPTGIGLNTNTLRGPNNINTWTITGTNAGSLAYGTTIAFSNFGNLIGGSWGDTFNFVTGGSLSGNIDGRAGKNSINYSGYAAPVTVNLSNSTATGLTPSSSITSISHFIANNAVANTFVSENTINNWLISDNNAGKINNTYTFSGFGNLVGGTAVDIFTFLDGISVSGAIDGGLGDNNTFNYNNYTTPVSINLTSQTATGTGGYSNIEYFDGATVNITP